MDRFSSKKTTKPRNKVQYLVFFLKPKNLIDNKNFVRKINCLKMISIVVFIFIPQKIFANISNKYKLFMDDLISKKKKLSKLY